MCVVGMTDQKIGMLPAQQVADKPLHKLYRELEKTNPLQARNILISKEYQDEMKILCKCGHWIGIVGTKWQHLDEITDTLPKQIKYRENCYHCTCIEPKPAE